MASGGSFGGYDEERFEKEVDSTLLCSICTNVLKDPVQCPNEHYCCRSCIVKYLNERAKRCPTCQHHMTEETLRKPPRLLTNMLQNLKIHCDHANRGCQELMKLEFLDRHVKSCGYSPTPCTNPGCSQVINQHEKERHETELCRFRMVVCGDCKQQILRKSSRVHSCFMRKEIDDLVKVTKKVNDEVKEFKDEVKEFKDEVKEVKDEVKQVKLTQEEFIGNLMEQVARQNDVVNDLCRKLNNVTTEMEYLTKESNEKIKWLTGRLKIFVCGGRGDKYNLNSTESYNWPENSWTVEPAMNEARAGPSAFVHEQQIYVSGGWNGIEDTDSIESMNVDEENITWIQSPLKMPLKCRGHTMITHENSVILTGGCDGDNVSDAIYEIELNPPYTSKLLTRMPEPRCNHGCHIIDNQVVVLGGRTSNYFKDAKNTVYAYDLNNNECKTLPALPVAMSEMASVSYKGNVILIGGVNEKVQTLDSVLMYDVKTGKIKMLPCLNHKRAGSAAVIIGNVVIVTGGHVYETKTYLNSVECLDLSSNVWKELTPMTTKRGFATAVVKPIP